MMILKAKILKYIRACLKTPFSDVSAPALKGEHQKISLPSRLRGSANFHLQETSFTFINFLTYRFPDEI
jgi:hypothetical protein